MKNEAPEKEYWEDNPEWTVSTERPGYRVKTVKHGNATIEIYRPILTKEEREKREAQVIRQMEGVLNCYYRRRALEAAEKQETTNESEQ